MEQHVKILGVLNIVYGGIGILVGLIAFAVLGGIAHWTQFETTGDAEAAAPILVLVGTLVVIVLAVVSAPAIIAGFGLLGFRPWARILGIIVSALHLMSIPFGTVLGIYGLWVLLSAPTEALFRGVRPPPPVPTRPYA